VSSWNLVLLPAGVEAGISVRESEINTSTLLVCSAQLSLPLSVLLHSSPPTEELLGEPEFSAPTSFLKIRFVTSHNAEAGYNRLFPMKVKSTPGRLNLVNWGPLHVISFPPLLLPLTFYRWSLLILMGIQLPGSIISSQDSCACTAVTRGAHTVWSREAVCLQKHL